MKNIFFFMLSALLTLSCSGENKKEATVSRQDENVHAPYDTTAIDSFSTGAISVDVAAQIRRSSLAYQDSVKQEIEKQKAEAEAKLLAEEKAKAEKEAEKKKKEASSETNANTPPTTEANQ